MTDYGIRDNIKALAFILNISIIGICKKEKFGYGKNPNAPNVYEREN